MEADLESKVQARLLFHSPISSQNFRLNRLFYLMK